jgi:methylated-DNA-[protein]-cysteine S-methyltransferase
MILRSGRIETPVGAIVSFVKDNALCGLAFEDGRPGILRWLERRFGSLDVEPEDDPAGIVGRLAAYLAGDVAAIEDVLVDTGGTPFQQRVWAELRRIPAGRTASYADVAAAIGAPSAVRAVGAANGSNPVSIVVPCHRVVASDGTLCGYGGGLHRKRWLLEHEASAVSRPPAPVQARLFAAARTPLRS